MGKSLSEIVNSAQAHKGWSVIIGTGSMMLDPQFIGPFSQEESSFMRHVYLLAEAGYKSAYLLEDQSRYALASIILYISSCERKDRVLTSCNAEAVAMEALDVLLSMPYQKLPIQ